MSWETGVKGRPYHLIWNELLDKKKLQLWSLCFQLSLQLSHRLAKKYFFIWKKQKQNIFLWGSGGGVKALCSRTSFKGGGGGGGGGGREEKRDLWNGPRVTFFFFFYYLFFFLCGDSKLGCAGGLASVIGRAAVIAASMLTEGVHDDKSGLVGHFVKVKDHVPAGLHGLPLVIPADLRSWRTGHTGVEACHLALLHCTASNWLDKDGFLADAGGDMPQRLRPVLLWAVLFCKEGFLWSRR